MIYYSNGTKYDIDDVLEVTTDFFIKDLGEGHPDRFIYPRDSIKNELDYWDSKSTKRLFKIYKYEKC